MPIFKPASKEDIERRQREWLESIIRGEEPESVFNETLAFNRTIFIDYINTMNLKDIADEANRSRTYSRKSIANNPENAGARALDNSNRVQ